MTGHMFSFWRPLIIIIALIILATSAMAASNLSFSKARDVDPFLRLEQSKNIEPNASLMTSSSRTDVDGHLVLYVAELTSRWWHDAMSEPPFLPSGPFENAVIAYPFDEEIYFTENYSLTLDWDATAAGFGDITVDNIKVVAALFKNESVYTHFVVPGSQNPDLYFDAYHLIAAAEATDGNPGSNYSDGNYTHTVFIDESAATW